MRDSLKSLSGILKLSGMDLRHVVDAHVYLRDVQRMNTMDAVFRQYYSENPPARTTLMVNQQQEVQVQVVAVR